MELAQAIAEFANWLKQDKARSTVRGYCASTRRYLDSQGIIDTSAITPASIFSFTNRFSDRTKAYHIYAIRSFLDFLSLSVTGDESRRLERLARSMPKVKYERREPRCLSEEEVKRLIWVARSLRDRCIIKAGFELGLRQKEVQLLDRDDVDLSQKKAVVKRIKQGGDVIAHQELPISEELAQMLDEYLSSRSDEAEALFVKTKSGRRIDSVDLSRLFRSNCKRAGVDGATFHSLRHGSATDMLNKGASVVAVAKHHYHRNLSSTLIYLHETLEHYRELLATR